MGSFLEESWPYTDYHAWDLEHIRQIMMAVGEVVEVDHEMDELHRLDRARIIVKTPLLPLIQHKVSAWINGVEYTVHIAEETCYNLDRCKCWGRSFIGSLEEIIFDDSESEIGTQMAIEGVILETDPSEEDTLPSTDGDE